MENKGLCNTCARIKTCIFCKNLPVWFCEEFSNGDTVSES